MGAIISAILCFFGFSNYCGPPAVSTGCLAREVLESCIETWSGSVKRESCFTEIGNGCAEGVAVNIVDYLGYNWFATKIENINPESCEARVEHTRYSLGIGSLQYTWNSIVCASEGAVTMNVLEESEGGSSMPPEMKQCAYAYSSVTIFQMIPQLPACPTTSMANYQQLRDCIYYDDICE